MTFDTTKNTNNKLATPDAWKQLKQFNYLRGLMAVFFITIYLNHWLSWVVNIQHTNSTLFISVAVFYFIISIIFGFWLFFQKPNFILQVVIHALIDIICIITIMHSTGSIRTGLGMLLILSIFMVSSFLSKKMTLLFAAITTLSLFAEQIFTNFSSSNAIANFTHAGLLGLLIFTVAILSSYSAQRLKDSEKRSKQTAQELETVVQMNALIIERMRTGILVVKNNGIILLANKAASELLGNINIQPKSPLKQINQTLQQRFIDWLSNPQNNTHRPIQQAQGLPDIQPGFSPIDATSHHLEPSNNNRTLIFLEDASLLSQRFQQIKLASLGRLTANIAHEIRNPLAAIKQAGQLLNETSENSTDKRLTEIINTQTDHLNNIIEDILQLSRQQNKTGEAIPLHNWLTQFKTEFITTNKLQSQQLVIKPVEHHIKILFDKTQLHQVFWNLCQNAIRHSKRPLADVLISIDTQLNPNQQVYINIKNKGICIDADTQQHLFEPFFTTSRSGTGLGLYIIKEILENNRAKIQFLPCDDGTQFTLYFVPA